MRIGFLDKCQLVYCFQYLIVSIWTYLTLGDTVNNLKSQKVGVFL